MNTRRYQSPLTLYVYWADSFTPGAEMAQAVYEAFCRDPEEPESRSLGIPVRFRSARGMPDAPNSDRVLRLIIVDTTMVNSSEWADEIRLLFAASASPGSIVPVFVTDAPVGELSKPLAELNAIYLKRTAPEYWGAELVRRLQHEVVRCLSARERPGLSPAPVRLFVSHAKRDGRAIAGRLKDYVLQHTELQTFFDANDIAPGHKFALEIFNSIEHSALVVVRTDAYASREWCRREVIEAKRRARPIVVIDALTKAEERGFPYLGNVPAIRWDPSITHEEMCRDALDLVLREVLRCTYAHEQWRALKQLLIADDSVEVHSIPRPPELLLPKHDAQRPVLLVYPDPPVGDEEAEVLAANRPEVSAVTPLMLSWGGLGHARPLTDHNIALSISEPGPEQLSARGLIPEDIDEMAIELARYMLASGARLRYGGDLRRAGFTDKLVTLVERHNAVSGDPFLRLENFLAWHIHLAAPTGARDAGCREVRVPRPETLELAGSAPHVTDDFVRARCLTAMRIAMNEKLHARIIVGGRLAGYSGRMPGTIEEASLALRESIPLFIVGGFGGAAGLLTDLVAGQALEECLERVERRPDGGALDTSYAAAGIPLENAPRETLELFHRLDVARLANGLSADENHALMTSVHAPEVLALILRGLRQVYRAAA